MCCLFNKSPQESVALRIGDVRLGRKALSLHHRGGVIERAQHPRHVAQPIVLAATLAKGFAGSPSKSMM